MNRLRPTPRTGARWPVHLAVIPTAIRGRSASAALPRRLGVADHEAGHRRRSCRGTRSRSSPVEECGIEVVDAMTTVAATPTVPSTTMFHTAHRPRLREADIRGHRHAVDARRSATARRTERNGTWITSLRATPEQGDPPDQRGQPRRARLGPHEGTELLTLHRTQAEPSLPFSHAHQVRAQQRLVDKEAVAPSGSEGGERSCEGKCGLLPKCRRNLGFRVPLARFSWILRPGGAEMR